MRGRARATLRPRALSSFLSSLPRHFDANKQRGFTLAPAGERRRCGTAPRQAGAISLAWTWVRASVDSPREAGPQWSTTRGVPGPACYTKPARPTRGISFFALRRATADGQAPRRAGPGRQRGLVCDVGKLCLVVAHLWKMSIPAWGPCAGTFCFPTAPGTLLYQHAYEVHRCVLTGRRSTERTSLPARWRVYS